MAMDDTLPPVDVLDRLGRLKVYETSTTSSVLSKTPETDLGDEEDIGIALMSSSWPHDQGI